MNAINQCRKCGDNLTSENASPSTIKNGYAPCRKCQNREDRQQRLDNRVALLNRFGNICGCCQINNPTLLSIEHINGNGIEDRNSFSKWSKYIQHLIDLPIENLLAKYSCLCYNCNYTRGFWGKCPHQFSIDPIPEDRLIVANHGKKYNHLPLEEYEARKLGVRRIIKLVNKLEMINAYGGCCVKCGENNPLFLTLDHINNNGNLENKSRGSEFYQYLKGFGYPGNGTQLQLLCHNCNAQKEYIERRQNKNQIVQTTPEVYIKQPYSISKELKTQIKDQARRLYYLIKL